MKDYYNVSVYDDYISISLYLEYEEVEKIAGKMEEANADAYMNGYNWEMFLNKYLEYNAPEILDVIDPDSEAGMYSAYINDVNEDTKALAQKFGEIIESLIENEDLILDFLEEHGDEVEWDKRSDMEIAVLTFRLRAPWVHSLKEKRMIVKSIIAKVQNQFHVSVSEIDEQDIHQIIVIGVAAIVPHNAMADSLMDEISSFVEKNTDAEILDEIREIR